MNDIELSVGFNQEEIDNGIKKIETQIKQTQSSLKKSSNILDTLEAQQKNIITRLEIEKNLYGENAKSVKAIYFELDEVNKKLSEEYMIHDRLQEKLMQEQQIRKQLYLNPTEYVNQTSQVANNTQSISNNLKQSSKEAKTLSSIGNKIQKSFSDALSPIKSMATRIIGLTKRVLFFSVIASSLRSFRDYMGEAINSNAQFSNSLAVVRENLSTAFASIFSAVLPALQSFMDWLGRATAYMASFIATLFGSTYKAAQKTAKSFKTQSKATKNLTKDTKKLNKEMSKQLANFDELNVLSQEISDNADSGNEPTVIGGGDSDGAIEPIMPDYDEEITKAKELANKLKEVFSPVYKVVSDAFSKIWSSLEDSFNKFRERIDLNPIIESFKNLQLSLQPFFEHIGEGIKWFIDEILSPLAAYTINNLVPAFLNLLSGAIQALDPIIEAAKDNLKWFWDVFLKKISEFAGGIIVDTLNSIGSFLSKFGKWLSEHKELTSDFVSIVFSFAAAFALVNGAIAIWNVVGVIATTVTTAFGAALAFLTSPIGLVIIAIGAIIAAIVLLVKHWDKVKETSIKVWEKIKEVWGSVKNWFNEKVFSPLINLFNSTKNIVINVLKSIYNFFAGIINKSISQFEFLANIIPEVTRFILKGLNWVIEKLNNLPGVNIDFRFNAGYDRLHLPRVPYLAQGAVIPPNREFLAMLGDQKRGTNIETPLETMKDAFRDVMSEFNNRGNGEYTFIAKLDSREIFRETVRQNEMYKKRIGRNAFA